MTKRMLIDATHDEETRVAVVDGRKLVEFDYESKSRKPLKGSIFLAKVTRVEPSLQAAFVNFGGNRHGFLPFAEIHPDYFRIPIADREALLAEQQAIIEEQEAAEREQEQAEAGGHREESRDDRSSRDVGPLEEAHDEAEDNVEYLEREDETIEEIGGGESVVAQEQVSAEIYEEPVGVDNFEPAEENADEGDDLDEVQPDEPDAETSGNGPQGEENNNEGGGGRGRSRYPRRGGRDGGGGGREGGRGRGRGRHRMAHRSNRVEKFGGEDYSPEDRFRFSLRRKYKIQEVIKRGQIMLVQVSKEERGNKGAAVSTYLSLPGRYCVLMPNSPRGGGVSRKIANYQDRARMKEIMHEIQVPDGMSVIVRTAGVSRTKAEIKRDLDYLMRLWDNIRELTLQSSAPAKVYEEADLIKRAVRDLYGKDIEEIVVAGPEGFETAQNFMKMMIPSHIDRVVEHNEDVPLFTRYHIEEQIAEIGEARVTLPSGGYLIINQTEALVAVDVNSGKATKERHIEETALKTNMEAASEIARQLRLRDLGGLVVIDFIDMEDRRNNAKVERRVREALSTDRARIQMSRISSFGLMELSRQRLNPSLTEAQFDVCSHCAGLGRVRTCDAMAIMVLRAIEDYGMKNRNSQIVAHVSNDVAVYILNNKRKNVTQIETRYHVHVLIRVDESMGASGFRIESSRTGGAKDEDDQPAPVKRIPNMADMPENDDFAGEDVEIDAVEGGEAPERFAPRGNRPERNSGDENGRGGRRRGRRGGRGRSNGARREWRDRDGAAPVTTGDVLASDEFIGNQREPEEFGGEDEFQDAAVHQAAHDQGYERNFDRDAGRPQNYNRDRNRNNSGGGNDDGGGRGGRNRSRGGRNRNRNDRPRREEGGDFNSRPPREDKPRDDRPREDRPPREDRAPRGERPQQSAPRREERAQPQAARVEEKFSSFDRKPSAPPAPKVKDFETVNPEPSEKKRGWWNRLTE